jgi:hypothetical protein
VLLLGACGLIGGDEEGDSGSAEDQGSDQGGGEESGGGDGEETGTDGLEGTWITGFEEPYNALVIAGETATFVKDSGTEVCTGPALNDTLALVCESGNTEFTAATFERQGDSLTVSWESGGEESYQRADDAALQELPGIEDIPGLEDLEQDLQDLQDLQDSFDN